MGRWVVYALVRAALVLLAVGCGVSIENQTPLVLPWSASGEYELRVHVDSARVTVESVRAEVDGTSIAMSSDDGALYRATITEPRCARGFRVRYRVEYRVTSDTGPEVEVEPVAGDLLVRITGVPNDCPVGPRRELVVNDLGDAIDAAPGDGRCATATSVCTLRAAVMESNALPGADLVRLPSGTITLSLTTGPHRYAIGIEDSLTIRGVAPGAGAPSVVTVDAIAGRSARVAGFGFAMFGVGASSSDLSVHLADLTLRGGFGLYGGAVRNDAALFVERVVMENASGVVHGGAVYNGGTLTMERSIVRNNEAQRGGAVFSSGTVVARACAWSGNQAGRGGALHAWLGRVELWNSTLSGNRAALGGALELLYPVTTLLRNTTVTENRASEAGGGIFGSSAPAIELSHSIVANNIADERTTSDASAELRSFGNNLVGVCATAAGARCRLTGFTSLDLWGSTASPLDVVLLPLADNGGATPTHLPHPASPAVDAGDPGAPNDADPTRCTRRDQRDLVRPRGAACDVGAVER